MKKGKDFAANISTCIAVYEELREAQYQLLSDQGAPVTAAGGYAPA